MSSRNILKTYKICTSVLLLNCWLGVVGVALAQTQIGADIDGEAADDRSGWSVSMSEDGNRVAIGAVFNGDNGDDSGHVRVYTWSGTAWVQLGADIDGEAVGDNSGQSVSLSADGSRVAIGAWLNDGNGDDSGHARVYDWSGTAWVQLGADLDGEAVKDYSGQSVSLSADGSRVAIGAWLNDGSATSAGHVRVYTWSGTAWAQLGADIDGEAAGDRSGGAVSMSKDGNRVAISAMYNWGVSEAGWAGHVRVYFWSGTAWVQLGTDIDGEAGGGNSGVAVSLSADGSRVAISSLFNGANSDGSGHVRVYTWSGTAWVQLGAVIDGEAARDHSGESVSLSADGDRVAIGARSNDDNGPSAGHVRVYTWSGTAWVQLGADIDGEAAANASGHSVSMSADGSRVAIGAPYNDDNGSRAGHVRVYQVSFAMNAGLNDAWYNPETDGQGFFITVFPDLDAVSLAWFTYDTELPAEDETANLGDPGHRWLTAVGPIAGNQAVMEIEMTSGGLFDTATLIDRTDPPGSDGTIILTFTSCNSATVEYDIPSINKQGIVPIQRVANDNIVICEALSAD